MKLSQLNYPLPKELIANDPVEPRDHSKLMVIDRKTGDIAHHHFYDLPMFLSSNDVLVFNNTKVFPARLIGKKDTEGKIEILLIRKVEGENTWEAMRKGKVALGQSMVFGDIKSKVVSVRENVINIEFLCREDELFTYIENNGLTPTPPYIDNNINEAEVRTKYQTVYAKSTGSVAAPTAGFHFTEELLDKIKTMGVQMEYVTLHVGLGTFLPIKEMDLTRHPMHEEFFTLDTQTIERLNKAKRAGKRIISVGTTTTRVLESIASETGVLEEPKDPSTKIFIYPPYKFKFVDSLITNFHLPHSTLLALVSAFVSKPNTGMPFKDFESSLIGSAYQQAIENKYRFYSFGDSSLIT